MTDPYRKRTYMPEQPLSPPPNLDASTVETMVPWLKAELTGRAIIANYSSRAVVCSPSVPFTYRTTPVFTKIGIEERRTDPEYPPAVLEAVEAYFHPDDPAACWYGIGFGNYQVLSNTPTRLLEDVVRLEDHLDGLRRSDDSLKPVISGVDYQYDTIVAAIWPIPDGWFYLEGKPSYQRAGFDWEYGLLYPGRPIDTTDITAFFTECAGRVPSLQEQWPERLIYAESFYTNALEQNHLIETGFAGAPVALPASNPFYAGSTGRGHEGYDALPDEFYSTLQRTSTLLYDCRFPDPGTTAFVAEEIIVVEPPTTRSMFVRPRAAVAR
jgi:hypothetical protein